HAKRRRLTRSGTAAVVDCLTGRRVHGRIARVQVSVAQKKHGRCRFLSRHGRLGKRKRCGKRHFLKARILKRHDSRGRTRWVLRKKVHLKRGHYVLRVRAIDSKGHRERGTTKPRSAAFKLR